MLIVNCQEEKSIEHALRTYKKKVQKTKLIQELNKRKNYTKPSVKKREVVQKAKYSSQFNRS
jgi:small subunit ribosomal protein S21